MNKSWLQTPILSSVIENRDFCLSLAGILGVHFTLTSLDLPAWQCPIRYGLGIPCPGCGLSRAVLLLSQGNWQQSLAVHGFAPLATLGIFLILGAGMLPDNYRTTLANQIKRLENKTGITCWLLVAFMGYWLIRLLIFPEILYSLVM